MVLSKQIGTILREAREARKLSIRDVARDTNMIPRYLEALENEDYGKFPGETYVLGFLRKYAEYLRLDTDHVLNLYRGQQIDVSQAPIQELTKPTGHLPRIDKNLMLAIGGGFIIIIVSVLFFMNVLEIPDWTFSEASTDTSFCKGRSIVSIFIPRSDMEARIENLSYNNALKFTLDEMNFKLCLLSVEKKGTEASIGIFALRVNDNENLKFRASASETVVLGSASASLNGLKSKLQITPRVLGDVSAKIQISYEGSMDTLNQEMIRITLEFIEKSYIEWESDGRFHSDTVEAGVTRILEAKSRLLIKLGNGGGVKIGQGKNLTIAGPPARIVKFTYKKVPDPLDGNRQQIVETKEVVQ